MKSVAVLLAMQLALPAIAQFQSSTSEHVTFIRGTISGNIGDQVCSAELRSMDTSFPLQHVPCSLKGFEFTNVPRGAYIVVLQEGINEIRQQVDAEMMNNNVEFRLPEQKTAESWSATVSVQEMRIPSQAKSLFDKASALLQQAKVKKAEEKLQQALKIAPQFPRALALQAVIFAQNQNLSAAIHAADTAVSQDSQLPFAQFVRAMVLNSAGKFREAEAAAEQGLRMDGNSWQGHFEKAHALYGLGSASRALREIQQAERTAPQDLGDLRVLKTMILLNVNLLGQAKQQITTRKKTAGQDPRVQKLDAMLAQRLAQK